MKTSINILILFSLMSLYLSSCVKMMDEAQDAKKIEPITVSYRVLATTSFVDYDGNAIPDPDFSIAGLKAEFTNFQENTITEGIVDEDGVVTVSGLTPGIYAISVSGAVTNNGQIYYLNGTVQNVPLTREVTKEEALDENSDAPNIIIRPSKVGPLCISEIYYCGIAPSYFRDQTYHIYNNGDEVYYLDSLCFAQLYPNVATSTLPTWPVEDGQENYVYALTIWQIPGSGTDYPLYPGESIIIAQEARNHIENNADSFDNSMAEWETWTGNASRDNPEVANLPYVFWYSPNSLQWLTSVFGSAFAIYKSDVPQDDLFFSDQANTTTDLGSTSAVRYAKIPAEHIIDGVELLPSMTSLDMKRIPGFVDAGATSVEDTYCGKSVSRKVIDRRADGTPIYQDTNNSTYDFQVNDSPAIRRNGEKAPSWRPVSQ